MTKYKYSSWMAAFILGLGIISYKPVKDAITEKPVNEKFTMAVYKNFDYSSNVYDSTFAQVHVVVAKINGSKSTVELDTTFSNQLLKSYPTVEGASLQQVTVPNVFANREKIMVMYELTYSSDSSRLQVQNIKVLENKNERVDIGI